MAIWLPIHLIYKDEWKISCRKRWMTCTQICRLNLKDGWSDLDDFFGRPPWNFDFMRARKICIMRIVDFGQFWPIFAQKCFGFCDGKFFPVMGNTWNFQGSISTARGTFEPKTPTYNPIFLAKNVLFRVQKYPNFFGFLSKGRLNLWAKYSEPKKTNCQNLFSFRSYKSLKFEFVCSRISPL